MNDTSVTMSNAKSSIRAASACGSLSITLHRSLEEVEADWRRLERPPLVSVHQSFDWCSAWARTHDSEIVIVRGTIGETPVLLLPLELHRSRLFRTLRFIGAEHSNINTGLFSEDLAALAPGEFRALFDREIVRLLKPVADIVTLENSPLSWRGHSHPLSHLPSVLNQNPAFQLTLHQSFEETLAQVNAKRRRKKFRTSERRLDAIGGYEHVVARTHEERHAFLDLFFRQKADRFAAIGLPDVFSDGETRAFFHALVQLEQPAPDIALELDAIRLKGEHDGRIVALAGLSRKGDHVICQFGSIDDEIAADASPGEVLFYLLIRRCCAEGVTIFDFGLGDQAYKRSWCNVETQQSDILLPLTIRGHIAALLHRGAAGLKSLIKKRPRAYFLLQRFRRGRGSAPAVADGDEN